MTYSSGGLIQAADYNTFQVSLNTIWSIGVGDKGWGQTVFQGVGTDGDVGVIPSVTIANTTGLLTVTSQIYYNGQQIRISGTLSAGTINGTANYTTPVNFYIIAVYSRTSIAISLTPGGSPVASTVGTATPGGVFTSTSSSSIVTATQWATLVNNLATAGAQTGTTLTSRTAPTAGTVIQVLNNVATDIASVTARRGYAAASGTTSSTWTGSIAKTTSTGSSTSPWSIQFNHTITFPSADQARYFWNAGGLIRLDMSKTSTGTDIDADWNSFIATVGTLYISGRVDNANQTIAGVTYTGVTRVGGSGTPAPNLSTTGWYQLTPGALTTLWQLNQTTYPYNADYVILYATRSSDLTTLTLNTVWFQSAQSYSTVISGGTNTASPFTAFGTAPAVLCRYIPPSTTYLSNSWGTPTIAASII
jgi:hypothetical protein